MECPEFQHLLLLCGSKIPGIDIPHQSKVREGILNAWLVEFDKLKMEMKVSANKIHANNILPWSMWHAFSANIRPTADSIRKNIVHSRHLVWSSSLTFPLHHGTLDRTERRLDTSTPYCACRILTYTRQSHWLKHCESHFLSSSACWYSRSGWVSLYCGSHYFKATPMLGQVVHAW